MMLNKLIDSCLPTEDPLLLARQQGQCWEAWLQPIRADAPVGDDPAHEDDFQRMREEVNKLSGADVEHVVALAERLLVGTIEALGDAEGFLLGIRGCRRRSRKL